jgi:hypothetical protein
MCRPKNRAATTTQSTFLPKQSPQYKWRKPWHIKGSHARVLSSIHVTPRAVCVHLYQRKNNMHGSRTFSCFFCCLCHSLYTPPPNFTNPTCIFYSTFLTQLTSSYKTTPSSFLTTSNFKTDYNPSQAKPPKEEQ